MNGIQKENTNGEVNQKLAFSDFDKEEVIRLMIQSLNNLGLSLSAKTLEDESGCQLELPAVTKFRTGILSGKWGIAEGVLHELQINNEEKLKNIKFLINQQKYLELLEKGQISDALVVLRNDLSSLNYDSKKLHKLTSLMMCSDAEELKAKANWDGSHGSSRHKLLRDIQKYFSPTLMIPENRLEILLTQALAHQKTNCLYHNTNEENFSLYQDHFCDRNRIPRQTKIKLEGHSDEVWFIEFSHNGKFLASASRDTTAIIWSLETYKPLYVLSEHEDSVSFLSWSPDDNWLLTCGRDKKLKLWDTKTGILKRTFSKHTDEVTSCAWLPDSKRFLSGSPDKSLYLWDIDGTNIRSWVTSRIFHMAVSHSGTKVHIVSQEKIMTYLIEGGNGNEIDTITESGLITSLTISSDDRYALVSLGTSGLHLWDLQSKKLIQNFTGHKQGNVVIRSCFGGVKESFVASGSEDHKIYLWHRSNGKLIEILEGHDSIVNAVNWNPVDEGMFASAGDDHVVRVWVMNQ